MAEPAGQVNNVVLKLTLDALGAKEEASGLVKAVQGFTADVKTWGDQMENTMRGRLIKGVIGGFKDSFSDMMNEDLPRSIRAANLQEKLAKELVGAIPGVGDALADAVGAAIKLDPGRVRARAVQAGTLQSFLQVTQDGRVQYTNEQAAQIIGALGNAQDAAWGRRQSALTQFHEQAADLLPSAAEVHPKQLARKALREVLPTTGEALLAPVRQAIRLFLGDGD